MTGWDVRGLVHVEPGAVPAQALDETRWLGATRDGVQHSAVWRYGNSLQPACAKSNTHPLASAQRRS